MPFPTISLLQKTHVHPLASVLVVLSWIGLAVAAQVINVRQPAPKLPIPFYEAEFAHAQTSTPATRLRTTLITLTPEGFQPAEVRRSSGAFFLAVSNRTGISDITLRIDREGGGRLREVRINDRRRRWAGVIDPPPGRYLVTEANHPGPVCTITITP